VPPTRDCGLIVPRDFYIVYESGPFPIHTFPDYFVPLLDTKLNILGKYLIIAITPHNYVSTEYYIPCEDLRTLYDAVIKYDIASYAGLHRFDSFATDALWSRITFCLDGEIYSIVCNFAEIRIRGEEYQNLLAFYSILGQCYTENDTFRSLQAFTQPP
jgi:hypothetical protein